MSQQTTQIDLTQLSAEELEKLLAEKRKQEEKERREAKKRYEQERDEMIVQLSATAEHLNKLLREFKTEVFKKMEQFKEKVAEYGGIRGNSKGGFSIRTSDSKLKIVYRRNTLKEFDERADMALEHIRQFLENTVKKRDQKSYKIISKLLVKNKAGDLNLDSVIRLISLKNDFSDEHWREGIELLEESYRNRPISYSIEFYKKNEKTGKDELLPLNFTAINLIKEKIEKNGSNNQ